MAGEVAQWLGVLAALAEELGLVPEPTGDSSQPPVTPGPVAPMPSLTLQTTTLTWYPYIQAVTHIHVRFKNLQIKQLNECVKE